MYKFKFTVVMAVYNAEQYLEESINSVVNQSIGFEKNIQLILVNDGSSDSSADICRAAAEKYPDNIVFIDKENGGAASARNEGLKYRQGKYINFLDSDDKLSGNAMSEVYGFFEYYYPSIDMVAIPLVLFEAMQGLHGKYLQMGRTNRIINLLSEPHSFILTTSAAFYKTEVFDTLRYDENITVGEDMKLNMKLHLENPVFGYVCAKGVAYYYRRHDSMDSVTNTRLADASTAIATMNILDSMIFKGDYTRPLSSLEKEYVIYVCRMYLPNTEQMEYKDEAQREELMELFRKYFSAVDPDFYITRSKFITKVSQIAAYLLARGSSFAEELESRRYLNTARIGVTVQNCRIENDDAFFEVTYNNFGYDVEPVIVDANNRYYKAYESVDLDTSFNLVYGPYTVDKTHIRRYRVSLDRSDASSLKFVMYDVKHDCFTSVRSVGVNQRCRFAMRNGYMRVQYGDYSLIFTGFNFRIVPSVNYSEYCQSSYSYILSAFKYNALSRLSAEKEKKYILINDRPKKAGDNGEAFFMHIMEHEPQLRPFTYFVIAKDCPDYERLSVTGHVVEKGSLAHKAMYVNAAYIFSSHLVFEFYNAFSRAEFKYYADLCEAKLIWLQHGIICNDVHSACNNFSAHFDKYITSTLKEFEMMSGPSYLYNEGQLLLTGLARYDRLESNPQNIITISPTWRKYLTGAILPDGRHEALPGFEDTEYYKEYEYLLTNDKFLKLLRKNKLHCNFVLHPGMNGYFEYFKQFECDEISVISADETDYRKVFSESKLLISDYSSIVFDFAYLIKPSIYFQFDKEEFFSSHYEHGWFSYEDNGFGDVISTADGIISKIEYYCKNDFKIEAKYEKRIRDTFRYVDKNNCQRILDATIYAEQKKIAGDKIHNSFIPREYLTKTPQSVGEYVITAAKELVVKRSEDNEFNHTVVADKLINGAVYDFSFDSSELKCFAEEDKSDVFSVVIFSKDDSKVFTRAIFKAEDNAQRRHYVFTVPAKGDYMMCVFTGERKKAKNKSLTLRSVSLEMISMYCAEHVSYDNVKEISLPDASKINKKLSLFLNGNSYKNVCLCDKLESGKVYEFSASGCKCLSGNISACTLRAFGDGIDERMSILLDREGKTQTFRFTVGKDAENVKLYLYSGDFAKTDGKLISVGELSLKCFG